MTLQQKQAIFAKNVAILINHIYEMDYSVTFAEAWRSDEQAEIYAKSGKGIKDSLHCKRLAIDLNLFDSNGKYLTDKKDYEKFGTYWKTLNAANRWGGDFAHLVDSNHYEMQNL